MSGKNTAKTKTKKFVEIGSLSDDPRRYRVTFDCSQEEYLYVVKLIRGYSKIIFEEIELEE